MSEPIKPELQRTLDALLATVHSAQRQVANIGLALDDVVPWYDTDVQKFRNGANVDARDELLATLRSLRALERIACVWGAQT